MMKITFIRDSSGFIGSFEADGHTGVAESGSDIACAGASALIQGAAIGCMRYLNIKAGYSQEYGNFYFCLPSDLDGELKGQAGAVLETMRLGLIEVEKSHPGAIIIVDEISE